MRKVLLSLCLASSAVCAAPPMTPAGAFNDGTTFGKANIGTAKAKISTTEASSTTKGVPNYTATDPASSYYMGGTGSLTAPAASNVTACTSGTAATDAHTHGKCEGVRMLMKDPGKKDLMFPLSKTADPLVVKRNAVAGDAETYLGSLIVKGAYSGCATKAVKDPDTFQTETCNQYLTAGEEKCHEILTVTVTTSESCVQGTWYGGYVLGYPVVGWINRVDVYCDMNRNDGKLALRFTPTGLNGACAIGYLDVPKAPFTVTDRVEWGMWGGVDNHELTSIHHWKGACTVTNYIGYEPGYTQGCVGDVCTYTFRAIDSRWGNQAVSTAGAFTPPKIVVTETDAWDNRCGPLEARLP